MPEVPWGVPDDASDDVVRERAASLRDWADLISERFVPLRIAPHDPDDLRGSVRTAHLGPMQASVVRSLPQTFTRTKAQVAQEGVQRFAVGLVDRGVGYLTQDGRECTVTDGGFALYDTSRPFAWRFDDSFRMRVYTWPLSSAPLTGPESEQVTAITVPRTQGVGRIVTPMLAQVSDHPRGISPVIATRLAVEMAELAITAALETGQVRSDGDGALLRSIQTHIEERLADPTLNADQVAAAFFMSTRTLHRTFARQGLTVAGWIKQRRLEGCRRMLGGTAGSTLTIREIAARFGLLNASSFSREFTARYGQSPRDYRLNRHP